MVYINKWMYVFFNIVLLVRQSHNSQVIQVYGRVYHVFFEPGEKKGWSDAKQHCKDMGLQMGQAYGSAVLRMALSVELYAIGVPKEEELWALQSYYYSPDHAYIYTRWVYGTVSTYYNETDPYVPYHRSKTSQPKPFMCTKGGNAEFMKFLRKVGYTSPRTPIANYEVVKTQKECEVRAAMHDCYSIDYNKANYTCRIYDKRLYFASLLKGTSDDIHLLRYLDP